MKSSAIVFGLLVCSLASLFTNAAGQAANTTDSPLDLGSIFNSFKNLFGNATSGGGTGTDPGTGTGGGLGGLGDIVKGLFNNTGTGGGTGGLGDILKGLTGGGGLDIGKLLGGGVLGKLVDHVVGGLTGQPKPQTFLQKVVGGIKNAISKVIDFIKSIVKGILAIPGKLFGGLKKKTNSTQPITQRAGGLFGFLGNNTGTGTKSGGGLLSGLGNAVKNVTGALGLGGTGGGLGGLVKGVTGGLGNLVGGITAPLKNLVGGIAGSLKGLLGGTGILGKIFAFLKKIANMILGPIKAILAKLTGGGQTTARAASGSKLEDLLKHIVSELEGFLSYLEAIILDLSLCCIQKYSPGQQLSAVLNSCTSTLSSSLNTQITQEISSLTCTADTAMPSSESTLKVADSDMTQFKSLMKCVEGVEQNVKMNVGQ